ncbi:MAG TPA: DVUA0089 family protein [Rubricoccaceae bacterium]|nr:DVUA0089 family protein [Rubricoccaceae bacterium]
MTLRALRFVPVLAVLALAGCDAEDPSIDFGPLEAALGCSLEGQLSKNEPLTGALDGADCTLEPGRFTFYDGENVDAYAFRLTASEDVRLNLMSDDFDTILHLLDEDGAVVATNDDRFPGGGSTDSEIRADLDAGSYIAVVTSFDMDEAGSYRLRLGAD